MVTGNITYAAFILNICVARYQRHVINLRDKVFTDAARQSAAARIRVHIFEYSDV